jgi:Siphovirus-type tail component, C-terminal domain
VPANVEWNIPFEILPDSSDTSTVLVFNEQTTDGFFVFDAPECKCGFPLRLTEDDIPQADGAIFHRRYRGGYFMQLKIALWETADDEACDAVLRMMNDELSRFINAMQNADRGRILWQPSGYSDQRMLDQVQLAVATDSIIENGVTFITVGFDTPFPYAIDKTQTTTPLDGGTDGDILTNLGTADFWPVIKVFGATSAFTITNESVVDDLGNPLQIVYDASLPGAAAIGGGDYVEIDCFRNTVYLNGNQANRKAGIDIEQSDFFPLVVGPNVITISGATADVLWNHAWA